MSKTVWRMVVGAALVWLAFGLTHVRAQTTREMNDEADKNFAEADAAMNKVYKQLCDTLDKEGLTELKTAQRLWVQFRDAEAQFESGLDSRGGSMRGPEYTGIRSKLTKERTALLRLALKGSTWVDE